MLKTKNILSITLVLLLTTLVIPMTFSTAGGSLTVNLDLPTGHDGHTPVTPGGFWLNTGTSAVPIWTFLPWGSTIPAPPAGTAPDYEIKVPAVVTDSQGHKFRQKSFDVVGGTATVGPIAEPAHAGIPVPTNWYRVDPPDPATANVDYKRAGPKIDVMRAKVVKNPDAQLIAMQVEEGVVLTDLIRVGDIEKLRDDGFTITDSPGFHMGHVGYNLRTDRDYLTEAPTCNPLAAPVLSDVWFRKACFHLYNQEEIVSSIYGYIVTPVQSLVPPSQGGWVNIDVEKPAFSTTLARQTLEDHGYVYSESTGNWITPWDIDGDEIYGEDPDDQVPTIKLWTPTYEVAPTSAEHGARFVNELNAFGLTSIVHEPREFAPYMDLVDLGDFDMYMVFWSLGRFPDHLESMCHSRHDVAINPADYNKPGLNDPYLDDLVDTIITSLDHEEKLAAAHEAQLVLYDENYPLAAFSYMQLYSRIYFNGFNADLRGIVNSPGYGSNNGWTLANMHWEPGTERLTPEGKTIIEWLWGEEPELLNPASASTVYAWDIISPLLDGLMAVNPYTHADIPWMATSWDVDEWPDAGGAGEDWMNVTFHLREDIFWQDGLPYTADDAVFNWLFLRNNVIPRYLSLTMWLEDAEVIDTYTARATLNTTSQFLLYDLAGDAAIFPPQVWSRFDGKPLETIMQYSPSTNTTKPTDAGAWFGAGQGFPGTQLFGTGPFVFEYYNPTLMVSDMHQFVGYFQATEDFDALKTEMFHWIGDVTYDGYIDIYDLARMGVAFGSWQGEARWDDDCNFIVDIIIDGRDLGVLTFHWSDQREYP